MHNDNLTTQALEPELPELQRLREIARLIGSIFVHGDFKAETHNERELEKLLREQGTFFETRDEAALAAIAADRNKREGELPYEKAIRTGEPQLFSYDPTEARATVRVIFGDGEGVDYRRESAAPVSAGLSDEEIRFRFFKNMNSEQRLAVFKAFGVYPDGCDERLNHSIERRLLGAILKRGDARALAARLRLPEGWVAVPWSGRTIELKTDPAVFQDVWDGRKPFELRFDDRGYQIGDDLLLNETKHTGAEMKAGAPLIFTGRTLTKRVGYILRGPIYGLAEGWVIAAFAAIAAAPTEREASEFEKRLNADLAAAHPNSAFAKRHVQQPAKEPEPKSD